MGKLTKISISETLVSLSLMPNLELFSTKTLPVHIVSKILTFLETYQFPSEYSTNMISQFKQTGNNDLGIEPILYKEKFGDVATLHFGEIPPILADEIRLYVPEELKNNYMALTSINHGTRFPPHIDPYRPVSHNYILKSGGSNVLTRWFDVNPEFKNHNQRPSMPIPDSKINLIESHNLNTNCWYKLDVTKIHDVINLESQRIILSL